MEIYHIYPVDDDGFHILLCTFAVDDKGLWWHIPQCKCMPTLRTEGDVLYVVHNSFDGREGVEWAREILES